jgi:putative ABC transport system permease protein
MPRPARSRSVKRVFRPLKPYQLAVDVSVAALALGLVLGVAYGWAGAQSLLGSVPVVPGGTAGTFVLPTVPLVPLAVVVVATAILTLIAAVVPTRLATRVAPVEALAG